MARVGLLDNFPRRIPERGGNLDEDHAGDLVGVLVRIAGGDVTTARGADEDVRPRDLGGLEQLLEVADKVRQPARTVGGVAPTQVRAVVDAGARDLGDARSANAYESPVSSSPPSITTVGEPLPVHLT